MNDDFRQACRGLAKWSGQSLLSLVDAHEGAHRFSLPATLTRRFLSSLNACPEFLSMLARTAINAGGGETVGFLPGRARGVGARIMHLLRPPRVAVPGLGREEDRPRR